VAWIQQVDEREATGTLAKLYESSRDRAGGVANIIRVMSQDADSAAQSIRFYISLMKSPNALSPARREMLAAVVSNVNDCYY
jgi:alkylhydroperoxidase family enzyme